MLVFCVYCNTVLVPIFIVAVSIIFYDHLLLYVNENSDDRSVN